MKFLFRGGGRIPTLAAIPSAWPTWRTA